MPKWSRRASRRSKRGRRGNPRRWRLTWTDEYGVQHKRTLKSETALTSIQESMDKYGVQHSVVQITDSQTPSEHAGSMHKE